jgi:hypothetical protein
VRAAIGPLRAIKVMERTYEEATEALHTGRESRHPEAALLDASMSFGVIAGGAIQPDVVVVLDVALHHGTAAVA